MSWQAGSLYGVDVQLAGERHADVAAVLAHGLVEIWTYEPEAIGFPARTREFVAAYPLHRLIRIRPHAGHVSVMAPSERTVEQEAQTNRIEDDALLLVLAIAVNPTATTLDLDDYPDGGEICASCGASPRTGFANLPVTAHSAHCLYRRAVEISERLRLRKETSR